MSLLNPTPPTKTETQFIDGVVEHLRVLLGDNLTWLDYNYGEQFTYTQDVNGARVLVPNVYIGSDRYLQTTIDNKKTGLCFFIVGNSSSVDYSMNMANYYDTPISIIFEANQELIDNTIDEYTREKLISETLRVLRNPRGSFYNITDLTVVRDLNNVFTEFGYDVREVYKFPLTAFRIDLIIQHKAEC